MSQISILCQDESSVTLVLKMIKPEHKLPPGGRTVLVITNDGQELIGVRTGDTLWQSLTITDLWTATYGKFNTSDVYAWGFLSDREWRNDNAKQN